MSRRICAPDPEVLGRETHRLYGAGVVPWADAV